MWSIAGLLADAGRWPEAVATLRDTAAADAAAEAAARAAGDGRAAGQCLRQRVQVHPDALLMGRLLNRNTRVQQLSRAALAGR